MHAFLFIGTNKKKLDEKIKSLAREENATLRPFAIGKIDDVRELKKTMQFAESKPVLYVLTGLETASAETSNALLKLIEEPGENKKFAITTPTRSKILPTILSRTHVFYTSQENNMSFDEETENFFKNSQPDQLIFIDRLRKRDDALVFIDKAISYLHTQLVKKPSLNSAESLESALSTQRALSSYANATIQLTEFVIEINK